jgi:hypothetical protein
MGSDGFRNFIIWLYLHGCSDILLYLIKPYLIEKTYVTELRTRNRQLIEIELAKVSYLRTKITEKKKKALDT